MFHRAFVVPLACPANMHHFLPVGDVAQLSHAALLKNGFNGGLSDAPNNGVAAAGNGKSRIAH